MAVVGEPVAGQAPQAQAEHARGEVRRAGGGRQQQKARVVDDQEQALAALQGVPADPALAGRAVQGRGVPAEQRQPALAEHGDVPQAAPAELAEAEVVVLAEQRVEARHLVGPHHAHLHGAQRDRFIGHCPSYGTNRPVLSSPISRPRNDPKLHISTLKNPGGADGGFVAFL